VVQVERQVLSGELQPYRSIQRHRDVQCGLRDEFQGSTGIQYVVPSLQRFKCVTQPVGVQLAVEGEHGVHGEPVAQGEAGPAGVQLQGEGLPERRLHRSSFE
jgi:hypothetical protein